jgi:hypothetical protein
MKNRNRYFIFLGGLLFTIIMLAFLLYANHPVKVEVKGIELKKSGDLILTSKAETGKADSAVIDNRDTIRPKISAIDTGSHKILLIGDSQVEGLRIPFYDYCVKNNHTLLLAAVWSSSTDKLIASNDTLKKFIEKYKPDYIVMVIGLNEMSARNLEKNELAVKKILSTFNGIPYSWIGPANYMPDKGINGVYQKVVDPGCFFLSKNLGLPRAKDGRHPNEPGNKIWMDSIGSWMNTEAFWRLKMNVPDSISKNRNINTWRREAEWTVEFNGS